MDDTTEQPELTPPAAPPPRRLLRSRRDRMLGGVCGGLAEHNGWDPTLVRLIAAGLVFLGGAGVVIYAVAWALLPQAAPQPDDPPVRWRWLDRIPPAVLIALAAIIAFGVFDGGPFDGDGPHIPFWPLALIVIGAVLVWGGRRDGDRSPHRGFWHGTTAPPTPPVPPTAPWPDTGEAAAATPTEPVLPTAPLPPVPPVPPTPPHWGTGGDGQPGAHHHPHRWGPSRYLAILVGSLMAALGVACLAVVASGEVSPRIILASGLIVTGIFIFAGAWRRRSRALIPAALVLFVALALWAAVDVPIEGGIGERSFRPRDATDLPHTERLAIGELTIDLRDIEVRPGERERLVASVGIGHLVVRVPRQLGLEVDVRASAGRVDVDGEDEEGTGADMELDFDGADGNGTVVLDLEIGLGEIEVQRVGR